MRLKGKKVVCLVEADFEDLELWYPVMRLREEGAEVLLAGPERGAVYKGKYGVPATADLSFDELDPEEYDGLLIPGGWAPDKLRRDPRVLRTVRSLHEAGKPIGQICHAGWVLISARILQGKRVTSTPGIRDDMENAGARWVDEPVVVDGNLVSSRRPPDLPVYAKTFCDLLAQG
ncbi:protease I [Planifilum fulgidum]|uniref:Protease I n=1 Tax=Planifilum fulgidum TaxID=201973 RepID=A0A1I2P3R6_9BACL|nr:type 1 glutamine amidotransferase domain-containing protein [Planifilum fulgidum]SFG09729.1 protease I [Planifilum fulgidum]